MDKIADGLMADGILTGAGKTKWHTSTINKILRNEKYMGDALLQKTYTTDFLTKKRIKNNGTVPQYYVEGDHEAIIPKELFMQVQAELVRRRVVHVSPTGKKTQASPAITALRRWFSAETAENFTGASTGTTTAASPSSGAASAAWNPPPLKRTAPTGRLTSSCCRKITVNAINQILTERGTFLKQLQANIAKAVVNADTLFAGRHSGKAGGTSKRAHQEGKQQTRL